MTPAVELVDPLAGGVPEDWSGFVRKHGLLAAWDAAALTAAARASTRPLELALVRDGADVLALLCLRYAGVPQRRSAYAPLGRRRGPGVTECSLPYAFSPGVAFARGLPEAGRRAAVDGFLRALARERGGASLGVVFRQIAPEELAVFRAAGRLVRRTAPVSVLENRWSTADDYFASLPRDRRRAFRRLVGDVTADSSLDALEAVDGIDGVEASRLDQLTRLKYAGRGVVAPIPVGYFDALSRAPGVIYFGHREGGGGPLLSFDLVFDDGARLVTTVTGRAADRPSRSRSLYLDQYLREIAFAIEHGRERLEWGKGMLELKARFGSVTVPQYAVGCVARPRARKKAARSGVV
jgi:hypothetical protein